jgi:acyl-coenzyme A synthetase/AMP-(fatty) acid ligase
VLILEGRNDDLVNSGGSKFNLAQLDLWLADSGLFEDVASFTETDQTGETLIGIVFVSNQKPDPETLISSLKNFLPTLKLSKMFAVDAIPRNKMDKVDRVAIQQLIQENRA